MTPSAPEGSPWAAWAASVRADYQLDGTGERLLVLVCEAAARYEAARDVLDAEGLTLSSGRPHPALAVERDTRMAISRLVQQLDLEEAHAPAVTPDVRAFTRRA